MESMLSNLGIGLSAVLAVEPFTLFSLTVPIPMNLVYAFLGAFIGTLIGVLPGIGPVATLSMLLPVTYNLPPLGGLIMLAGIYYGASYGGSTTAIMVNLPGEISSVVTCIDGYQMALNGRAGVALTTAALGSFFAGCVGTLLLAAFAAPLAEVAFKFGPAEYFSLMVLGLIGAVVMATKSLIKAIAMIFLGLLCGIVGTDVNSGVSRYAFGIAELSDGIGIAAVAMGVFGFAEVISNLEQKEACEVSTEVFTNKISTMFPTKADYKRMVAPILRGTAFGSLLGILPGGGVSLATFVSYTLEKKLSRNRSEFGKGAIEGVASPESANNAAAQTQIIPLLALGVPPNAVMALMLGAMMIHNIQPGPQVMTNNPELFWGLIVSMWFGNLMLLVLNLPLIGIWVKLLTLPYRFIYPAILVFCSIGAYTININTVDVFMAAGFGLLGYVFRKLDCEGVPLMLGFVLGPMIEEYFRRSLLMSRGDFSIFFTRPISLGFLIAAMVLIVIVALPFIKSKREELFEDESL